MVVHVRRRSARLLFLDLRLQTAAGQLLDKKLEVKVADEMCARTKLPEHRIGMLQFTVLLFVAVSLLQGFDL